MASDELKRANEEFQRQFESRKREAMRENSDYQRTQSMTQEERSRRAIDWYTKDIKDYSEARGSEMTEDRARKMATQIARDAERRKD